MSTSLWFQSKTAYSSILLTCQPFNISEQNATIEAQVRGTNFKSEALAS
jgi:hypothetical protein